MPRYSTKTSKRDQPYLTYQQFIRLLALQNGTSIKETKQFYESFRELFWQALASGWGVSLTDFFRTYYVYPKYKRYYSPTKKEWIDAEGKSYRRIQMRPSRKLKEYLKEIDPEEPTKSMDDLIRIINRKNAKLFIDNTDSEEEEE